MIGPPMYKQEQIKALKEKLASEVRSHKRELIRIKEIRAMESNNRRKSFEKLEELQNTYTEMLKTKRDSSLSNSSHTSTEKHSRSKSISPSPLLKHSIYSEDPYSLKTPHTEYSKQTSISPYKIHLDRVSQLQNHAKRILQKEKDPSSVLTRIHEEPELNASTLKKIGDIIVPLRYPVYVPTSTLRKAQNLPPQFVNMTTKTGEVFPVHILGDPTPAYDPLIKVESTLKKAESPIKADGRYKRFDGNESVEAKAYTQFDFSEDSDEYWVAYWKKKDKIRKLGQSIDSGIPESQMTSAPKGKEHRAATPKGKYYSWNFRELAKEQVEIKAKRKWVRDRMDIYYDQRVKKDFLPVISDKKSLEIQLVKEKADIKRPKIFQRVKLGL